MNGSGVATLGLDEVKKALGSLLGSVPVAVTPDAIATGDVRWTRLPNWETISDVEIARRANVLHVPFAGDLVVVTEASFSKQLGAFTLPAAALAAFIAAHEQLYGECFFNGDVVIVNAEPRLVWLFHHEGAYTLVKL